MHPGKYWTAKEEEPKSAFQEVRVKIQLLRSLKILLKMTFL